MVDINCKKCGAKLPEGAKFCLSCGSKIEEKKKPEPKPQPQTPPPSTPTPISQPRAPMGNMFETLFSKTLILAGVLLGLLLAWIGSIVSWWSFQGGSIIGSFGFFALSVFLFGGGLTNSLIDKNIRLGMLISGAITVSMGLSSAGLLSNLI